MADTLTKEGTLLRAVPTSVAISTCLVASAVNKLILNKWDEQWKGYVQGRMTKQFFPKLQPKKSAVQLGPSRTKVSLFVALVTGHNDLEYFSSLCDESLAPGCSYCNVDNETFFHFCYVRNNLS